MIDLAMLFTPVCVGLALGQALSLVSNPYVFKEINAAQDAPNIAGYPQEWDECTRGLWKEANADARKDRLKMAKRALEACPDISCDQVAEAFGLPKMSVRSLSKGGRTGKRVQTNYSHEEIMGFAGEF